MAVTDDVIITSLASISGNLLTTDVNGKLVDSGIDSTIDHKFVSLLGDGVNSILSVNHALNSLDVSVVVRNTITGVVEEVLTTIVDADNVDFEFTKIPTSGEYTVVIFGAMTFEIINFDGVSGPLSTAIETKVSNYTTTLNDNTILCNGDFILTLHDPTTAYNATLKTGQEINLNNIGVGTVGISGSIQGNVNPDMNPNEIFNIISNGVNWYWKS